MNLIDLIWVTGGVVCLCAIGIVYLYGQAQAVGPLPLLCGIPIGIIMLALGYIGKIGNKVEGVPKYMGDRKSMANPPKMFLGVVLSDPEEGPHEPVSPSRWFKDFLWWVFFIGLIFLGLYFAFPGTFNPTP